MMIQIMEMMISARRDEKGGGGDDTSDDSNCDLWGDDGAAQECESGGDDARARAPDKIFRIPERF